MYMRFVSAKCQPYFNRNIHLIEGCQGFAGSDKTYSFSTYICAVCCDTALTYVCLAPISKYISKFIVAFVTSSTNTYYAHITTHTHTPVAPTLWEPPYMPTLPSMSVLQHRRTYSSSSSPFFWTDLPSTSRFVILSPLSKQIQRDIVFYLIPIPVTQIKYVHTSDATIISGRAEYTYANRTHPNPL